jgi:hypothetical protein
MTSFNIFKSIFNSSFEFYGLSERLLELMPDNVNLNHYIINHKVKIHMIQIDVMVVVLVGVNI